jgi:hypothetical protein
MFGGNRRTASGSAGVAVGAGVAEGKAVAVGGIGVEGAQATRSKKNIKSAEIRITGSSFDGMDRAPRGLLSAIRPAEAHAENRPRFTTRNL